MGKFVCLLFVAALVSTGYSLKCYRCTSNKADGCLKNAKPNEQACGNAGAGQKSVCYYKELEDSSKKAVSVDANCALLPTGTAPQNLNECMAPAGFTKKECRVCETDLCNSAPALSTSFFVMLCLPVIYLVNKLY